eukprot:CAMPEP_0174745570 /NCGR_PEP_ID=MMETSP1094-20130205/87077_1 /TAXON_ID=156173 /ORGANISM="Chrysochromulina brevifilum, Strain UTEX LB 985" /LENGTH=38 /DNA_ID= /DNA_START= /DNA_END= /DNA_ORIENTATION=
MGGVRVTVGLGLCNSYSAKKVVGGSGATGSQISVMGLA